MPLITHLFSTFVALALTISSLDTSQTASSSPTMNASGNTALIAAAGVAGGAALLGGASLFSSGLPGLTSFGGRVVSVIPCSGAMLHVTIIPAGLFPISYIWTPFTVTKLYGPPIHPGQQLLGLADVPFVCFVGGGFFVAPVPLYGLRMTTVGTSL